MKNQFIFLDDYRKPEDVRRVILPPCDWSIVKNFNEFCQAIEERYQELSSLPSVISFDFDLSEEHYGGDYSKNKTGLDCAKWLVDFCLDRNLKFPVYYVHSLNPEGSEKIIELIESQSFPSHNE